MLDMHAPQGGFQGPGYEGNFWTSSDKQDRMKALWVAIAERYKDEPVIAAYDIFNEPDPNNQQQWVDFAQELIDTIRVVDDKRLFIVEQSMNDDVEPFLVSDGNVQYDFQKSKILLIAVIILCLSAM
jgi:endoglucanase